MDEKISKSFLPIIDKLYNIEPAGEPFRHPVDPAKYACWDYYDYVKHPIDLSTIRHKLVTNQYKDAWRCVADLQLMFSNAYIFNKKGTPVYEWATKLNKIWNNELTNVMPRLNYCCGALHKFGPQLLFCHGTTPDRYCQIAIGSKYKCYKDSFSFCVPCFNKIETQTINLQTLTCETTRLKLPTQPVKKSDFNDCTNDRWQYEYFINCTQCTRRIHQICDLYPADDEEIAQCLQHDKLEDEQKSQRSVPREYQQPRESLLASVKIEPTEQRDTTTKTDQATSSSTVELLDESRQKLSELQQPTSNEDKTMSEDEDEYLKQADQEKETTTCQNGNANIVTNQAQTSLDDELLQFARNVDDIHSFNWNPASPNPDENMIRFDSVKELRNKDTANFVGDLNRSATISRVNSTSGATSSAKNSVDNIAARLSINKLCADNHVDEILKSSEPTSQKRGKYVCNHCYKKDRLGFNLRHRKYSARRIPHTRMSRFIETKVNEYIREISPSAGEMTIRVLTAYRDKVEVKPEMKEYLKHCKTKDSQQHPYLEEYPDEYEFTTRAIFAWQEIDGVDVCVFGMHVQEYGDDCPEPNKQVVYLSYLDSVHFFRPKQFRTAVYHEILLSYFRYVKKLGFRRVFIWVCPSRKGDDYIFYRHPTEQKMPTLKRLSDWYIHLLDKGTVSGVVERHQNIYEYAISENITSVLSLPYLSGDYWPGEFERLLKTMIESQKKYDEKMSQNLEEQDEQERDSSVKLHDISDISQLLASNYHNNVTNTRVSSQINVLSPSAMYQDIPTHTSRGKMVKSAHMSTRALNSSLSGLAGDEYAISTNADDSRFYEPFTPSSIRSDDQPLDLSKSNSTASPESYYDDDHISETSYMDTSARKRRKKSSNTMGYTKKRSRIQNKVRTSQYYSDSSKFGVSQKGGRKSSSVAMKDSNALEILENPEQELIKNLERSLKRQKEGFIVVHLRECDCSSIVENQRRREEVYFACDLMQGREPFLKLARQKNYEFSTVRRAKFSSLAMVKHLGERIGLDPICNECFSFDSSKRHYFCPICKDYYLCTSCQENIHHEHFMSQMPAKTLPEIQDFIQECSPSSAANSISSASSTISNRSFNDTSMEPLNPHLGPQKSDLSHLDSNALSHRHLSNTIGPAPLSCKRQRNREPSFSASRTEDEENAKINPFASSTKLGLARNLSPPPSHSSSDGRTFHVELDQVLVENLVRHAELNYDIDFDEMKGESKKLLTHYWGCPIKDTCPRCKFVVLSCSFMSVLMRSPRFQMIIGSPEETTTTSTSIVGTNVSTNRPNNGINLTTNRRLG